MSDRKAPTPPPTDQRRPDPPPAPPPLRSPELRSSAEDVTVISSRQLLALCRFAGYVESAIISKAISASEKVAQISEARKTLNREMDWQDLA